MTEWPRPLLQPDSNADCWLYATTYLCHALGHPEVTTDEVLAFAQGVDTERPTNGYRAAWFPRRMWGLPIRTWRDDDAEPLRRRWWLGSEQRDWLNFHLAYQIGLLDCERAAGRRHSVVVLEGGEQPLVMDPLYGLRRETWAWVLGPGPGHGKAPGEWGSHHVEALYQRSTGYQ